MPTRWWQAEVLADDVQHALDYVNEARRRPRGTLRGWELDACKDCFNALDYLCTTLLKVAPNDESSLPPEDRSSLSKRLTGLLKTIEPEEQAALLTRPSVKAFAIFEPSILDHSARGMSQLLQDVPEDVRAEAGRAHDEFKRGWTRWRDTHARTADVLRRLSRAVLVVRNNLSHGEKTRFGRDRERSKRNREVAAKVLPVLEDFLDFILDRPSHKLCAYGTLCPGQPNHGIISADGTWLPVTLLGGVIEEDAGLPVFTYAKDATARAELFNSSDLPGLWQRLDAFEGSRYERVLGLYGHGGLLGVANVYIKPTEYE